MIGTLGVVEIVRTVFWAYKLMLLVRVLMSWFRTPSYTSRWLPVWNFFYAATEPLLAPMRRVLLRYTRGVPIDLPPLVLFLLLSVIETIIIRALIRNL